jgi:hypothetical protein
MYNVPPMEDAVEALAQEGYKLVHFIGYNGYLVAVMELSQHSQQEVTANVSERAFKDVWHQSGTPRFARPEHLGGSNPPPGGSGPHDAGVPQQEAVDDPPRGPLGEGQGEHGEGVVQGDPGPVGSQRGRPISSAGSGDIVELLSPIGERGFWLRIGEEFVNVKTPHISTERRLLFIQGFVMIRRVDQGRSLSDLPIKDPWTRYGT